MPPKQGQQSGPQSQKQQVAHFKPGQVHYTTLEGIPEGALVMTGTFSVNGYPVSILFDSGASHTFISKECAIRLGLKIESMPKPCHIYSPGGKLITNQFVKQVPLQWQGNFFSDGPYNVTNPKGGYYSGHELDGGSWSYSGHDLPICTRQILYSWSYDLAP